MKILVNTIDSLIRILSKTKESMSNQTVAEKIYVWTKTEKAGSVVQVSEEQPDKKWLYFTDGTRINPTLIKEYLMEARDLEDANNLAKSFGNSLGATIKNKPETVQTGPVQDQTPTVATNTSSPVQKTESTESKNKEVNVMMEMLSKMSRKNTAQMPVTINIPAPTVYEMLMDQMDLESDDLNEQIGLLVENQINNLQEQLKEQIQSFISNYYNNER